MTPENLGRHTHTHGGDRDWLYGSTIAYVLGVEPKCKVFHYISIKLYVGLK